MRCLKRFQDTHTHAQRTVHNVFIFSSYFGSNPNKLLCFKPPDLRAIKPHYNSTVYLVTRKNIVSVFVADGRFSIYVMSIDRMYIHIYIYMHRNPYNGHVIKVGILRTKPSGVVILESAAVVPLQESRRWRGCRAV